MDVDSLRSEVAGSLGSEGMVICSTTRLTRASPIDRGSL
jgi:hypothetical protein